MDQWLADDTFVDFHDDVLLPKAEATEAVKLFRWFAEFPLVEKVEVDGVPVLRYRDLRFRSPMPWGGGVRGRAFAAVEVVFGANGDVVLSRWARGGRDRRRFTHDNRGQTIGRGRETGFDISGSKI